MSNRAASGRIAGKTVPVIDVEITAVDMKYTGWPARLVLASNVTQRRRREDEARQVHKMEIITQVSGGVADHFSTILSSIESNTVSLAQRSQDPPRWTS